MACKYLSTTTKFIPGGSENGGSFTPQGVSIPVCKLGREPDIIGGMSNCQETPTSGPRWFWVENHGDAKDLEFA